MRVHLNLDVRGACVRPKKRSQLTPCNFSLSRSIRTILVTKYHFLVLQRVYNFYFINSYIGFFCLLIKISIENFYLLETENKENFMKKFRRWKIR